MAIKHIPFTTSNDKNLLTNTSQFFNVKYDISGGFDIDLYSSTAELRRVDKSDYLTKIGTIRGVLRESASLTNTVITIKYSTVPIFNYIYIKAFNRWYFVNDITSVANGLWDISIQVDVLMTYKNVIYKCNAFCDRNEYTYDTDIVDNRRVIVEGADFDIDVIPNELFTSNTGSYVLTGFFIGTYSLPETTSEVNNE